MHSLALYLLYCRFDIGFLEVFKVEKQICSAFDDEDNIIFDLTTTSNNHYRRVPWRKWTGSRSAFVYILHNIVKGEYRKVISRYNFSFWRKYPESGERIWRTLYEASIGTRSTRWKMHEFNWRLAREISLSQPLSLSTSSSRSSNQTLFIFFFNFFFPKQVGWWNRPFLPIRRPYWINSI